MSFDVRASRLFAFAQARPALPAAGYAGPAPAALPADAWRPSAAVQAPAPGGDAAAELAQLRQMIIALATQVELLTRQAAASPNAVSALALPVPAAAQSPARALVGPVPLEGYDAGKLHDASHQTAKYKFGRVASHYPLTDVKDHAGAEALLKRMLPDLQAAGLTVKAVDRDKILVTTEIGDEWVDVVARAGAGNPGWWWGSEGKAVPGSSPAPGAPAPGGPAAPEPGGALTTVPLTPAMKAAADAILAGDPSLKNRPAALTKAVAQYVKDHNLAPMPVGDDRPAMYDVMTQVIGIVRSMGLDAFRVVNHPTLQGPPRYGSDAIVLNGRIYDVYRAFGQDNDPVEQDVGPWNRERAKGLRE